MRKRMMAVLTVIFNDGINEIDVISNREYRCLDAILIQHAGIRQRRDA